MCVYFLFFMCWVFSACTSVYKPAFFCPPLCLTLASVEAFVRCPHVGCHGYRVCANVCVCDVWMDVCREPEIQLQTGTLLASLAHSLTRRFFSFFFFLLLL